MRTTSARWLALAAFGLLASARIEAAQPFLRLLTEDYPPFNFSEGQGRIGGMSTDIVQELLKRAGIGHTIELMPWIRAFNLAVLEPATCVYSTTRTESREHQFKWIGPLVENPWVIYARDNDNRTILNLETIRPYKIGGYSGDAVSQYLIDRGFEVDLSASDALNVRKLAAGRIDYWATGKYLGAWLVGHDKQARLKQVLTFNTTFLYLACNPALPDQQVQLLNAQLHGMQRDGTLGRIAARYLPAD